MRASTSPPAEVSGAAVFLDRDGTIIRDVDYPSDPAAVELLPGAAAGVARLNAAGWPVVLITNQSGIGRGYLGEAEYRAVHQRMVDLLAEQGARLDGAYHCPHAPADPPCGCRKPGVDLYRAAAREHGLRTEGSWFVGDRARDVLPAAALKGRGILLHTPGGHREAAPPGVEVAGSLSEAVDRILEGN